MSQLGPNNESQRTGKLAASSASTKKPYKVVLESVTQEKKKLRSDITYELDAPSGYTFVPVGAPDLTEYCKELSRKRGLRVFIVSFEPKNKAHKNPSNISHHIHRVGYHFANDVVDVACNWLGYTSRGPKYVRNRNSTTAGSLAFARRLDSHAKRLGASGTTTSPDREREKVAGAIKDLFPKIPAEDQEAIVTRAFEEGTARVGNANLPLARRVQLAVVAHIRHTKTDYDSILKNTNWQTARQSVEQACLEQIVKWRGEDETGEEELEDIFQEVIVLDDENDTASSRSRDSSVEIISSNPIAAQANKGHGNGSHSQFEASHGPRDRSQPEIVHVQPRRALALPPVLQQTFRRRWNEARARVGFTTTGGNADRGVNEAPPPAVQVGAPEATTRKDHYTRGPSKYDSTQISDARPRTRLDRTSNSAVYPSIEPSDRSRRIHSPGPIHGIRSHSNQEPLLLYDKPLGIRDADANRPFYVPDNREREVRFVDYDFPYESRNHPKDLARHPAMRRGVDLQGVKRKSLLDAPAHLPAHEQMYLHSPLKRVRISDDRDVLTAPPRNHDLRGMETHSSTSLHYEAQDYPTAQHRTDSHERLRTDQRHNDRGPPSHAIDYATHNTDQRQTRSMRGAAVATAPFYPLQPSRTLPPAQHTPQLQHRERPAEYTPTNGSARSVIPHVTEPASRPLHPDTSSSSRYHHQPSQPEAPQSGYHLRQRRGPASPGSSSITYPTMPIPQPPPPSSLSLPLQPQRRTLPARDTQVRDEFPRMRAGRR